MIQRFMQSLKTRCHQFKLAKKKDEIQLKSRHTFSSKIVDKWNSLSEVTVTVNSINIFKSRLNEDNLNDKKFLPT